MKKCFKITSMICLLVMLSSLPSCSNKKNENNSELSSEKSKTTSTETTESNDAYNDIEVQDDSTEITNESGKTTKVIIDENGNEVVVQVSEDGTIEEIIDQEEVSSESKKVSNTKNTKKVVEKPVKAVEELKATYDGTKNQVILNWSEPEDSTYAYVIISENGQEAAKVTKGETTVSITPKTSKENKYTFTSYNSKDKSGYSADCTVKAYMFTSMEVPLTGTAGHGNKVTCYVEGENFNEDYVKNGGIKFKSPEDGSIVRKSRVNVIDNQHFTFDITIPATAGNYDVTVSCGNNTITKQLKVKQSPELLSVVKSGETPVAIITGYNTSGIGIGLGLVEQANLHWAVEGSFGYNTIFEDIVSIPSVLGTGSAEEASFNLDIDGFDNWQDICKVDNKCLRPDGSLNTSYVETNYPLFYSAIIYGDIANIPSKYSNGWFIPTAKEMCDIYRNGKKINKILDDLNGDKLSDDFYWTSTQNESRASSATAIRFQNAAIFKFYPKSNAVFARCVREFPEI